MRNPTNLTPAELATIVSAIQDRLYLDLVDHKEVYNSDKEWSGGDVCQDMARVLSQHGLVPDSPKEEKQEPKPRQSSRIVVVIHDTVVQGVYASDADSQVVVVDWDVHRYDDTVAIVDDHGQAYHADVYRLAVIPLEQLPGSHTYMVLQRAGIAEEVLAGCQCRGTEEAAPATLANHAPS